MDDYDGLTPREELELRLRRAAEREARQNKNMNARLHQEWRKLRPAPPGRPGRPRGMSPEALAAAQREMDDASEEWSARHLKDEPMTWGQLSKRTGHDVKTLKRWETDEGVKMPPIRRKTPG